MKKEELPVTSMLVLLELMSLDYYGSRKVRATLYRIRTTPPETYVEEIFDDGGGHSNAITGKRTPISEELFQRAVQERFIEGVLEPGYVSQTKFVLSLRGRDAYMEKQRLIKLVCENLHQMNAMRASDLQPLLNAPERDVAEILDWLVAAGAAESYEQQGQKFYLRTEKAA